MSMSSSIALVFAAIIEPACRLGGVGGHIGETGLRFIFRLRLFADAATRRAAVLRHSSMRSSFI